MAKYNFVITPEEKQKLTEIIEELLDHHKDEEGPWPLAVTLQPDIPFFPRHPLLREPSRNMYPPDSLVVPEGQVWDLYSGSLKPEANAISPFVKLEWAE